MQLLASCSTHCYDIGLTIVPCSMLPLFPDSRFHHRVAPKAGLINCLQLYTRLSKGPAFGHHARNASLVSTSPGLTSLAISRVQLIESQSWDTTCAALTYNSYGLSNQTPRRPRTQSSDSQDENSTVACGDSAQYLSERQSRYTEDFDHSLSRRASGQIRPLKEHLVHQWRKFKRKTRSDISTFIGRGNDGPKDQRSSHHVVLQGSPERYDVGSDMRTNMDEIHEQHRPCIDRSSSAPRTLRGHRMPYNHSSNQEPSRLLTVQDVVSSNYRTILEEAEYSHFVLETRHTDSYIPTRPSLHRLHRTSTSGTTVYTPRIIAEANPYTEKLEQLRGSDGSSNGSSGNGKELLSFL